MSSPRQKCTICLEEIIKGSRDNAVPTSCKHIFHRDCIETWATMSNTCPLCKERFKAITVVGSRVKIKCKEANLVFLEDEFPTVSEDPCLVCGSGDNPHLLLLCDTPGCDAPYHTYCIGLDRVPEGDWFCPTCHDYGEEQEPPANVGASSIEDSEESSAVRERSHQTSRFLGSSDDESVKNMRLDFAEESEDGREDHKEFVEEKLVMSSDQSDDRSGINRRKWENTHQNNEEGNPSQHSRRNASLNIPLDGLVLIPPTNDEEEGAKVLSEDLENELEMSNTFENKVYGSQLQNHLSNSSGCKTLEKVDKDSQRKLSEDLTELVKPVYENVKLRNDIFSCGCDSRSINMKKKILRKDRIPHSQQRQECMSPSSEKIVSSSERSQTFRENERLLIGGSSTSCVSISLDESLSSGQKSLLLLCSPRYRNESLRRRPNGLSQRGQLSISSNSEEVLYSLEQTCNGEKENVSSRETRSRRQSRSVVDVSLKSERLVSPSFSELSFPKSRKICSSRSKSLAICNSRIADTSFDSEEVASPFSSQSNSTTGNESWPRLPRLRPSQLSCRPRRNISVGCKSTSEISPPTYPVSKREMEPTITNRLSSKPDTKKPNPCGNSTHIEYPVIDKFRHWDENVNSGTNIHPYRQSSNLNNRLKQKEISRTYSIEPDIPDRSQHDFKRSSPEVLNTYLGETSTDSFARESSTECRKSEPLKDNIHNIGTSKCNVQVKASNLRNSNSNVSENVQKTSFRTLDTNLQPRTFNQEDITKPSDTNPLKRRMDSTIMERKKKRSEFIIENMERDEPISYSGVLEEKEPISYHRPPFYASPRRIKSHWRLTYSSRSRLEHTQAKEIHPTKIDEKPIENSHWRLTYSSRLRLERQSKEKPTPVVKNDTKKIDIENQQLQNFEQSSHSKSTGTWLFSHQAKSCTKDDYSSSEDELIFKKELAIN